MTMPSSTLALLAIVSVAILAGACARSEGKGPQARLGNDPGQYEWSGGGDRYAAHDPGASRPASADDLRATGGDIVYFSSDRVDLTHEARQSLTGQARWLQGHPSGTITIEGHADERGTREYNIALGSKRAATVKSFLVAEGVNSARIKTTSYGKERPIATCNDISCWSQNRRAQTVLNGAAAGRS